MRRYEVCLKHFGVGGVVLVKAEKCSVKAGKLELSNSNGEVVWMANAGEWIFFGLVDEEKYKEIKKRLEELARKDNP